MSTDILYDMKNKEINDNDIVLSTDGNIYRINHSDKNAPDKNQIGATLFIDGKTISDKFTVFPLTADICSSYRIINYRTVEVIEDTLKTINGYLNADSEDEYQGDFNTISLTAKFDNGIKMDIKCCGSDNSVSWAEAVLFNENSAEIACSDCEEEFTGRWMLYDDDEIYVVDCIVI